MSQFITDKDLNTNIYSKFPAFVFYFNNHHIYLMNCRDVRHALVICIKPLTFVDWLKQRKKKYLQDLIVDVPHEDRVNYKKTKEILLKLGYI